MNICFLDDAGLDYTPDSPYDRPLGGTQSAVAYLTAALAARGHDVTLINETSQPGLCRGVNVLGRSHSNRDVLNTFDVAILPSRPIGSILRRGGVTIPLISWQHQSAGAPALRGLASAEERAAWTDFAYVSDQQRSDHQARVGVEGGVVIRNAVSPPTLEIPFPSDCFLDRGDDPILIYASAPGRGLDTLLIAFVSIREQLKNARLLICSDQEIYQNASRDDIYTGYYALARALPGVEFLGTLSQTDLARRFASADIWAYPTHFLETSCIVAMEAAAMGCDVIANDYGPLRETLAGYGAFLPYMDNRPRIIRDFAALVVGRVEVARADPEAYKRNRRDQAEYFRATHTWDRRAQEWEAWLRDLLDAT